MIQIIPPPMHRREELCEVAAQCFEPYYEFLRYCRQTYFTTPSYDWQASRVAEADGRIVSHVGVWRYAMRVGSARLTTGGIGAVLTHADFRKQGLAAQCMNAVLAAMRDRGYHYSMLFGIRDFYHRFGFVQAWPEHRHTIAVADLPEEKLRLALRRTPLTEALCGRPTGAVLRIHERDNATRTGTAVRPLYTTYTDGWDELECRVLAGPGRAGDVHGYIITRQEGETLEVREAGGWAAPCGTGQLLAAAKAVAVEKKCRSIRLPFLAANHPLCQALRAHDCKVEENYTRSGRAMGAVVSLRGCLEAMAGELTARLARSQFRTATERLEIVGADETVALEIARGKVRVAAAGPARKRGHSTFRIHSSLQATDVHRGDSVDGASAAGAKSRKSPFPSSCPRILAGPAAARLILGSDSPAAMANQTGLNAVRFTGRALELAEALFPQQWPMLYRLDGF